MMMRRARSRRDVLHRGLALGLTMALHLAVFFFISRPVVDEEMKDHAWPQSWQALQLRLIRSSKPSPSRASTPVYVHAAPTQSRQRSAAIPLIKSKVLAMRALAAPVPSVSQPFVPESKAAAPIVQTLPSAAAESTGDGGFADRLRQAQQSYSVRPLPGSDRPRVNGIQLIDPKTQGVAATVRQLQRLFGRPNHHCIDVDAWHRMSPDELSARHISPSDVARVDAENQCNRPMGLSF